MTDDKISEIKWRHLHDEHWRVVWSSMGIETICPQTHDDRGYLLAEDARKARHIEELREKIDAERSCACSFDAQGDVCAAHSPALAEARAEVERLQAVVATLEIVGKAADDERQTMRERIEQLHEIIENNGVPCVIRRLL